MRLGRRHRPEVVVHTREGCGLCRRAEELVRREARGCEVRTVDIDRDPVLRERYTVRVPVVTVDGVEVAELEVQPGEVRAAVSRARRARR
jgi:glutaredoxin